jgi:1,4-dihydroxy-2-naphthoyl-CoA hydrolase
MQTLLEGGLCASLGMRLTAASLSEVVVALTVDERTRQPYGVAHGGALASLAETVASVGGLQFVDYPTEVVVGQHVSIDFLRPARGEVVAKGRAVHVGGRTQVWDITLLTGDELVAVARVTVARIPAERIER